MNPLDSPFMTQTGRDRIFLEAKELVEDQFRDCSSDVKLAAIAQIVQGYCTLLASERIAHEIAGSLDGISQAITEAGDE